MSPFKKVQNVDVTKLQFSHVLIGCPQASSIAIKTYLENCNELSQNCAIHVLLAKPSRLLLLFKPPQVLTCLDLSKNETDAYRDALHFGGLCWVGVLNAILLLLSNALAMPIYLQQSQAKIWLWMVWIKILNAWQDVKPAKINYCSDECEQYVFRNKKKNFCRW